MKLHPNARKEILRALRSGMSLKRAADLVGYSIEDVRSEMKSDPLFKTEVRQAVADPEYQILEKLQGSAQWQAWKFLLQSLYPDRYYASHKRKKHPPKLAGETNEERLARLDTPDLLKLRPILAKMDGKPFIPEPDPNHGGERQTAGREDTE